MAIAPSIYHIRFSDTALTPIVIQPGTVDLTSTSLSLPGSGRLDYGNFMDENVLHMLEHFSNAAAPNLPITGQIWFKKDSSQLYVYNGNIWEPILTTINGNVPFNGNIDLQNSYRVINSLDPVNPQDGATKHYVDTTTVANPIYVKKAGDTMTGPLTVDLTANTIAQGGQGLVIKSMSSPSMRIECTNLSTTAPGIMLVNPDNTVIPSIPPYKYILWVARDGTAISIEGRTADTTVLEPGDSLFSVNLDGRVSAMLGTPPALSYDLTNKQYVDNLFNTANTNANNRVLRAGDTMTGYLTLNANPVNAFHAATKQYVDSNASKVKVYASQIWSQSPVARCADNNPSIVNSTLVLTMTLNFPTPPASVIIMCLNTAGSLNTSDMNANFGLYRGTTALSAVGTTINQRRTYGVSFIGTDTPPAGNITYNLRQCGNLNQAYASYRSMTIIVQY